MDNKLFCTACGNKHTQRDAYCSACGMSVAKETALSFSQNHQTHCTLCGVTVGADNTYCAACGAECNEYIVSTGVSSQILGAFGGRLPVSVTDIAGKAAQAFDNSANVKRLGNKEAIAPAILFAFVAVAVGLILSFILDLVLGGILREQAYVFFGTGTVRAILGDNPLRLGANAIWLLTLLGGFGATVRGEDRWGEGMVRAEVSLHLGIIWLVLVPIVALSVAKVARKMYINAKYDGKDIHVVDGLLGAGIFTVLNFIIALFPTALGSAVQDFFVMGGELLNARMTDGSLIFNLVMFSFLISLLFSMPKLSSIFNIQNEYSRLAGLSIGTALRYVKLMLSAGIVITVIVVVRTLIAIDSDLMSRPEDFRAFVFILLVAVPNMAIWYMSYLSGGTFTSSYSMFDGWIDEYANLSSNAFGVQGAINVSWFGILYLLAGLWIAVAVVYKTIRNEEKFISGGLATIATSAVAVAIVSGAATIAFSASASVGWLEYGIISASLSSASFVNFLLLVLVMTIAVFIVYAARKVPAVDKILGVLAKPAIAIVITIIAALVAVLTIGDVYDIWGTLIL